MIRLYSEPEAEEELDHAADRYEASVPGLGQAALPTDLWAHGARAV
jgi:hypothetical protein